MKIAGLEVFTPDNAPRPGGKWLIYGRSGTGKTTLASTIAVNRKTLMLDLVGEQGTISFAGSPQSKNIDVVSISNIVDLEEVLEFVAAGDHDYEALILDSLSSIRRLALAFLEKRSGWTVKDIKNGRTKPTELKTWGQAKSIAEDIAINCFGLAAAERASEMNSDGKPKRPMDVVLIGQACDVGDEETDEREVTIDVQRGARTATLAAADYTLYTYFEEDEDAEEGEDGELPLRHVVKFCPGLVITTKQRIPPRLWGKMPRVLGRKKPASLTTLSQLLGLHDKPAASTKK